MAKRQLSTFLGKLHKLSENPRVISDGAFTSLCESLMRKDKAGHGDIELLMANRIVVWMVPDNLPGDRKDWPWEGQEGQLVTLSGNQRYDALVEMGYEKIPDEWIAVGKYGNGEWWSPEHAERFILLANSPEGVSGETDYEKLVRKFNEECLRAVGMDFSQAPMDFQLRTAESVENDVEEGEHGEMDQDLHDFIERRENSRGMVEEMMDAGFYCVNIFETHDQKMEYLGWLKEKYGIENDRELFVNGFQVAKAMGKEIEYSGLKFPKPKPSAALQEMAIDGSSEGWESESGSIPDGTNPDEEKEDEKEDEGTLDGIV